jgi:ABC-type multidrug transport system ATPase subunit
MPPILKTEGIVKRYGRISALRGIDLDVERGRSLAVLGPNGAGKSTLLGILAGRVRPTAGRVIISGEKPVQGLSRRGFTGYLSHSSLLYKGMTARENLLFYGNLFGVADAGGRTDEMLHFIGLWDRRNDVVGGFSRGMEQRLSIARSLLHDPQLILLDEPFSGLDLHSARVLYRTLDQLRDGNRTLVIATHDLGSVEKFGDQAVILSGGRIAHHGSLLTDRPGYMRDIYMDVIQGAKQ